jgi:peptidoglycan/xylan/chitin deacetylase (PgdA/CDA1 family)
MRDVLVLCYHAVSERWPAGLSITPERLEDHLGLLVRRGYRGITFHEAVTAPPTGRSVAVTFDDAFLSVFELAFPILSRFELTGTLFVPTLKIGGDGPMAWRGIDHWLGGPYESELTAMSWEQVGELASAGWEIGSHTRSHPHLTQLDDEFLVDELRGSREDCEQRLGRPCPSIAYPYGDVDARVMKAAGEAGYVAAGALSERLESGAPLNWPRVGIYYYDNLRRFRMKASPTLRRLRSYRVWPFLSRIGHFLYRPLEKARKLSSRGKSAT